MSSREPNASPSGGSGGGLGGPIESAIIVFIVGLVYRVRDAIVGGILGARDFVIGGLSSGGGELLGALSAVGSVPIDLLGLLEESLVSIASSAGPFAPIVTIGLWALVALSTLALIRGILWALPLVIPWL